MLRFQIHHIFHDLLKVNQLQLVVVYLCFLRGTHQNVIDVDDILSADFMPGSLLMLEHPEESHKSLTNATVLIPTTSKVIRNGNKTLGLNGGILDAVDLMTFHRSKMNEYMCRSFIAEQIIADMSISRLRKRSSGVGNSSKVANHKHVSRRDNMIEDEGSTNYKSWLTKSTTLEDIYKHYQNIDKRYEDTEYDEGGTEGHGLSHKGDEEFYDEQLASYDFSTGSNDAAKVGHSAPGPSYPSSSGTAVDHVPYPGHGTSSSHSHGHGYAFGHGHGHGHIHHPGHSFGYTPYGFHGPAVVHHTEIVHDEPKWHEIHESHSSGGKDLTEMYEIALTTLAYLSFGMFICHVVMCISQGKKKDKFHVTVLPPSSTMGTVGTSMSGTGGNMGVGMGGDGSDGENAGDEGGNGDAGDGDNNDSGGEGGNGGNGGEGDNEGGGGEDGGDDGGDEDESAGDEGGNGGDTDEAGAGDGDTGDDGSEDTGENGQADDGGNDEDEDAEGGGDEDTGENGGTRFSHSRPHNRPFRKPTKQLSQQTRPQNSRKPTNKQHLIWNYGARNTQKRTSTLSHLHLNDLAAPTGRTLIRRRRGRRRKREIEAKDFPTFANPNMDSLNELARHVLISIEAATVAPQDDGVCLRQALCQSNRYSRSLKNSNKLWIPIWSLGMSWLSGKVVNSVAQATSMLDTLKASVLGLGKANCEVIFQECDLQKERNKRRRRRRKKK